MSKKIITEEFKQEVDTFLESIKQDIIDLSTLGVCGTTGEMRYDFAIEIIKDCVLNYKYLFSFYDCYERICLDSYQCPKKIKTFFKVKEEFDPEDKIIEGESFSEHLKDIRNLYLKLEQKIDSLVENKVLDEDDEEDRDYFYNKLGDFVEEIMKL